MPNPFAAAAYFRHALQASAARGPRRGVEKHSSAGQLSLPRQCRCVLCARRQATPLKQSLTPTPRPRTDGKGAGTVRGEQSSVLNRSLVAYRGEDGLVSPSTSSVCPSASSVRCARTLTDRRCSVTTKYGSVNLFHAPLFGLRLARADHGSLGTPGNWRRRVSGNYVIG